MSNFTQSLLGKGSILLLLTDSYLTLPPSDSYGNNIFQTFLLSAASLAGCASSKAKAPPKAGTRVHYKDKWSTGLGLKGPGIQ